ncbi:hypothetical protein [Tropicimonas isoalkanivorans]|nr:hypothetical protein [Tropicimonas isoalkanivorans]
MTQKPFRVLGVSAAPPRPTFRSALWLACALSITALPPLVLVEALLRWFM